MILVDAAGETTLALNVNWEIAVELEGTAFATNSPIGFERGSTDADFTVGTLDVDLEPGRSIVIDANNGDSGSFIAIVDDGDV